MARPFRFVHEVEVRFKDIDVGGHAHHSHALVYFEEARSAYWAEIVGRRDIASVDYILAEISVRYQGRVFWPQTLRVGIRVARLGRKHFTMEYEVRGRETGELLIEGSSTQIMFDYAEEATKPIPDEVRDAIDRLDGPFGRGGRPEEV